MEGSVEICLRTHKNMCRCRNPLFFAQVPEVLLVVEPDEHTTSGRVEPPTEADRLLRVQDHDRCRWWASPECKKIEHKIAHGKFARSGRAR